MPTLDELGWLAGIVDGEGTIGLYRQHKGVNYRFAVTLIIPSTDPAIILKARRILWEIVEDDTVRVMNVKARLAHHKPQWRINVTTRLGLYKVLDAILPYLSGKAPKAELVKQWCQQRLLAPRGRKNKLTDKDIALAEQFDRIR